MKVTKIRTGDYVEVLLGGGNTGVEDGEQGLVIDGEDQTCLILTFPENSNKVWVDIYGPGWRTTAKEVKLVWRRSK